MTENPECNQVKEDDFHKHDVNLYFLDVTGEQKQRILDGLKAIDVLGKIEIYVRLLQDGDPENEKPNEILDYIEKEIQPMLKVIYNE